MEKLKISSPSRVLSTKRKRWLMNGSVNSPIRRERGAVIRPTQGRT
jgi:hypothetical protein